MDTGRGNPAPTTQGEKQKAPAMTGAWYDKAQYPVDLVQVRAQIPVLQGDVMMSMVVAREH